MFTIDTNIFEMLNFLQFFEEKKDIFANNFSHKLIKYNSQKFKQVHTVSLFNYTI